MTVLIIHIYISECYNIMAVGKKKRVVITFQYKAVQMRGSVTYAKKKRHHNYDKAVTWTLRTCTGSGKNEKTLGRTLQNLQRATEHEQYKYYKKAKITAMVLYQDLEYGTD